MIRIAIGLAWLLHFLPMPVAAWVGQRAGDLFFLLGRKRRRITLVNLHLCMPNISSAQAQRLARAHCRVVARSFLERGFLWWSSRERIMQLVRLEGQEHLENLRGRPVILLAPHFVALDAGWARLSCEYQLCSIYVRQKNPHFDRALLRGRLRFNAPLLYSRQDGIRGVIRALAKGTPLYYLPDMDYGVRDTLFVPFFGVPAATITTVSRLARMTGAAVLPCITRMLADGSGYAVRIHPAWEGFPGADLMADTLRMNQCIEQWIAQMPEQYYWLHRRFKSRPPGVASPYNVAS